MLATAVQEGVKENLAAIIERIEKENITIEPKTLSDAKGRLAKMKWKCQFVAEIEKKLLF